jgi:Na+-transporting NADH:ubiquinone oxidoreductase subunit C
VRPESARRTIGVALAVSLVCSILVSATAVSLHERQEENRSGSVLRTILADLDLIREGERVARARERTETMLVELATGEVLPPEQYDETLNLKDFDIQILSAHPEYGRAIPGDRDLARISRMPRYMKVFTVRERDGDAVEKYAFQIYGRGLYSTMYGVLALKPDLETVDSVTFYDHGETPGLGGEIENSSWKGSWRGKQALDGSGNVLIEVLDGPVDPARPGAESQIDGLSGATFTTRGVDNLVKFWLGEDGYGPYLRKLRGG